MKRRLQEFSFKESPYERPNQRWICGRAPEGKSCLDGPDKRGHCRGGYECRPLQKEDKWVCTRPGILGGPCPEGSASDGACSHAIAKCRPIRSWRSRRGLLAIAALFVSAGALLILSSTRAGRDFMSPGELSFAHSTSKSQCSDCHVNAEGVPLSWFQGAKHAGRSESELCLDCHAHDLGAHPFQPHSLGSTHLTQITKRVRQTNEDVDRPASLRIAGLLAPDVHAASRSLECSTCHVEHQGKEHELSRLSNQQCQSCHAIQFASFAHDHPPLRNYPFKRRTRIIFDHDAHFRHHEVPVGSCLNCHTTDPKGEMMVLMSFDQACAKCHYEKDIQGMALTQPGVPFLRVPALDAETLNEEGAGVGRWPELSHQDLVTSFMELFIASDTNYQAALETVLEADAYLDDLQGEKPAVLEAAQRLGWSIKTLLFDLAQSGQTGIAARVQAVMPRPLTPDEAEGIIGLLSPSVIREAVDTWFSRDLAQEVAQFRAGTETQTTNAFVTVSAVAEPHKLVPSGGWYRGDGTLYYRPSGHADRFLAAWLNLAAAASETTRPKEMTKLLKEISSDKSAGRCLKCHSIDDQPVIHVNWRGARPRLLERSFTRFSHAAHASLLDDQQGCFTCHAPSQNAADYAKAFEQENRDPFAGFASYFQPIDKATCASCHTRQFAGDSCLTCHNYHVGEIKPMLGKRSTQRRSPEKGSETTASR